MREPSLLYSVILFALLAGSAFFSASETAFFSLNFLKVKHLQSRAGRRGQLVAKMMVRPKQLIVTILIGNELINISASSMVGAYLIGLVGPQGRWYAIGIMTFLLLVFCEITPKTLAVTYPVGFALKAAPLLYRFSWLMTIPNWLIRTLTGRLVALFGGQREAILITEDEFKGLVREGSLLGVLDRDEEDIIYNILELGDSAVSSLMIPRTDLFALEESNTVGQVLDLLQRKAYSRIPVFSGDLDNIVGILYIKDLLMIRARRDLAGGEAIGKIAKKPFIVPENMRADKLFIEFRKRHVHMAVIVDEYGGTAGIITMDDLLRHLFEDVSRNASADEGVSEDDREGIDTVSGKMAIDEFNRLFQTTFSHPDITTVGGMLLHLFGRLPRAGDTVRLGELRIFVTAVDKQRITEARIERPRGTRE